MSWGWRNNIKLGGRLESCRSKAHKIQWLILYWFDNQLVQWIFQQLPHSIDIDAQFINNIDSLVPLYQWGNRKNEDVLYRRTTSSWLPIMQPSCCLLSSFYDNEHNFIRNIIHSSLFSTCYRFSEINSLNSKYVTRRMYVILGIHSKVPKCRVHISCAVIHTLECNMIDW